MALKAALLSLGCKVNAYETERIREDMEKNGFKIVDFSEKADVYIVNTCSVTNIADRKSRQMLHRAKALNPDSVVVATGCYVQVSGNEETAEGCADLMIGNNHKGEIAEKIISFLNTKNIQGGSKEDAGSAGCYLKDDIACEQKVEDLSIRDYPERNRAFIRIEDGCNQFCSYCIIPYARGRVRSRDENDILSEVRTLSLKGFKEVVLTGIHISSYGYENYEKTLKSNRMGDMGCFDSAPLLSLVRKISDIPGIQRIRLGSLEPRIITGEFASRLKEIPSFCPHFHLSLQSGSDTVLKRMNRHYTKEEFLLKVQILREVFENPSITTDVIVGFPSESLEEFEETVSFVKEAAFSKMHIFKFSRRKGTVADRMPGQITEKEKQKRSRILQAIDERMHREYAEKFVGKTEEVLIEEEDGEYMNGLTARYLEVRIKKENEGSNVNRLVRTQILKMDEDGILIGRIS